MAISMYTASVPVFVRMLENLLRWLDVAETHAKARKFDPDSFVGLRLAPDMLAFARQIQIATDHTKGCVARLAGVEAPRWADEEKTLDELRARVRKAIDYAKSVPAAQIEGSDAREITLPIPGRVLRFTGETYLLGFALPNFYFHVVTAYDILRSNGVELGKRDYIGTP